MKKIILNALVPVLVVTSAVILALNYGGRLSKNFSYLNYAYAQEDTTADNPLTSTVQLSMSGMFNERGFSTSNSFSFDENEVINDFNGNLQYSFPMYHFEGPGDIDLNLSVNYNGNVSHNIIAGNPATAQGNADILPAHNFNIPGWIISLNGMAVQMTNFETNMFTREIASPTSGNDVRLLAVGYHLSDRQNHVLGERDHINILRGDGSVLRLENTVQHTYVGDYYSSNLKDYARAKVEFIEAIGPDSIACNRRVTLTRGDGLTFIYEEHKIEYFDYRFEHGGTIYRPQVLLLKAIKDRFGNPITLEYDLAGVFSEYGRPLLTAIDVPWITGGNIEFTYASLGTQGKIIAQNNLKGKFTINTTKFSYLPNEDHRAYVTNLTDVMGRQVNVQNESYSRHRKKLTTGDSGDTTQIKIGYSQDVKRISSLTNYNGGKRTYTYVGTSDMDLTEFTPAGVGPQAAHTNTNTTFFGQGRDAFHTNMVSVKKCIDKGETSAYRVETYGYHLDDNALPSEINPVDAQDIYKSEKTVSTEVSTHNYSTPEEFKWVKTYKNFQVFEEDITLENSDWPGETKMVKEEFYKDSLGNPIKFKEMTYDFFRGRLQISGSDTVYHGDFSDTLITETIGSAQRKTRFQKDHFNNFPFGSGDDSVRNPIERTIAIDPLGRKTETKFLSMYENNVPFFYGRFTVSPQYDNVQFYTYNLPVFVKQFSPSGTLLSYERNEYLDTTGTTGYIGQLTKKKIFDVSDTIRFKEITNEYYMADTTGQHLFFTLNDMETPEGELKKTTDPMGNITKFYHNLLIADISDTNVVKKRGSFPYLFYKTVYPGNIITDSTMIQDKRMPIRVDNYVTPTRYISDYNIYNGAGSLSKNIGWNNYLSAFAYDKLERINDAVAPYDFAPYTDTVITDTVYQDVTFAIEASAFGSQVFEPVEDTLFYGLNTSDGTFNSRFNLKLHFNGGSEGTAGFTIKQLPFMAIDSTVFNALVEIDTAMLYLYPSQWARNVDGDTSYTEVKLKINALSGFYPVGDTAFHYTVNTGVSASGYVNAPAVTPGVYTEDVFKENIFDVTTLMRSHLITSDLPFKGFVLDGFPTDPPHEADYYMELMLAERLAGYPHAEWKEKFRPTLVLTGKIKKAVTYPLNAFSHATLKYQILDDSNKVRAFNKLYGTTYKKNETFFDGFYRVKENRQYVNETSFNRSLVNFNYLDQKAKTTDGENVITEFSYNEFGSAAKTKNTNDTSFTYVSDEYLINLITSLDTITGFVHRQGFTDEVGNKFDKYFDAAGNLVRELKFLEPTPEDPGIELDGVPLIHLATDYLYDDMYRVKKVRTPEGKIINYSYDGYGRQIQRTTVDAGTEKFWYDKNDNLIYSQDAKQKATGNDVYTERKYDGLNRLTILGETEAGGIQPEFDSLFIADSLETDNIVTSEYLVVNVYDTLSTAPSGVTFTAPAGYTSALNNTKGQLVATAYRTHAGDPWNFKYFRYDARGRVIKMWTQIDGLPTKAMDYTYNSQNQATNVNYQPDSSDVKKFNYWYDAAGRLGSVSYHIPGYTNFEDTTDAPGSYKNLTRYSYDSNSSVLTHNFDSDDITNTYTYNKRNWVQQTSNTFFRFGLQYYKNGNVDEQYLLGSYDNNLEINSDLQFKYTYDKSNRITKQDFIVGDDNAFTVENSYDKDGNILTLKRYDGKNNVRDDFTYAYYTGKNRLSGVDGEAPGNKSQYRYDSTGNVTFDNVNGIFNIQYDHRNLLTEFKKISNDTTFVTRYYYDEAGNRVKKIILRAPQLEPVSPVWDSVQFYPPTGGDAGPGVVWTVDKTEYYVRDAAGKELAIYNGNSLDLWNIWALDNIGKIENNGKPFFYMKDHLGSTHAVVDTSETIVSTQDFDMWGYSLPERLSQPENAKYDFTGKERDTETGYDYFGARYYDSRIGRWSGVDLLFQKHYDNTPYNYVLNKPLILIDPDGKEPTGGDPEQPLDQMYGDSPGSGGPGAEPQFGNNNPTIDRGGWGRGPNTTSTLSTGTANKSTISLQSGKSNQTVTLYRAVDKTELGSIIQSGNKYTIPKSGGTGVKYFWSSKKDMNWFVRGMEKYGPFAKTKVKVPAKLLKGSDIEVGSDVGHKFITVGKETLKKFPKLKVIFTPNF